MPLNLTRVLATAIWLVCIAIIVLVILISVDKNQIVAVCLLYSGMHPRAQG